MLCSVSRIASFRELLATGQNECHALIDAVASAAEQVIPACPEAVKALLGIGFLVLFFCVRPILKKPPEIKQSKEATVTQA